MRSHKEFRLVVGLKRIPEYPLGTSAQNGSHVCSKSCKPSPLDVADRHYADFEVTDPLPNVTDSTAFPLGKKTFAGNIPVNRAGHPNDTLFFWAVERDTGSLTASEGERADEPWLIWLNGGLGPLLF